MIVVWNQDLPFPTGLLQALTPGRDGRSWP